MNKINGSEYDNLNIWRGEISQSLHDTRTDVSEIKKDLKIFINESCPDRHRDVDERVVELEIEASNRKAIKKFVATWYAIIGGAIVWGADKIWILIK